MTADTSFEGRRQRSKDSAWQHANDRLQCPPDATPCMRAAYALGDSAAIQLEREIAKVSRRLAAAPTREAQSLYLALRRIRDPRVVQLASSFRMSEARR